MNDSYRSKYSKLDVATYRMFTGHLLNVLFRYLTDVKLFNVHEGLSTDMIQLEEGTTINVKSLHAQSNSLLH